MAENEAPPEAEAPKPDEAPQAETPKPNDAPKKVEAEQVVIVHTRKMSGQEQFQSVNQIPLGVPIGMAEQAMGYLIRAFFTEFLTRLNPGRTPFAPLLDQAQQVITDFERELAEAVRGFEKKLAEKVAAQILAEAPPKPATPPQEKPPEPPSGPQEVPKPADAKEGE